MKTPSCDDCVARVYGSTGYMADEEIQIQAVADFIDGGFCAQFGDENVEACGTALEIVLPTAMSMFAAADVQWAVDFCTASIGCM